jgi:hypothetical protein
VAGPEIVLFVLEQNYAQPLFGLTLELSLGSGAGTGLGPVVYFFTMCASLFSAYSISGVANEAHTVRSNVCRANCPARRICANFAVLSSKLHAADKRLQRGFVAIRWICAGVPIYGCFLILAPRCHALGKSRGYCEDSFFRIEITQYLLRANKRQNRPLLPPQSHVACYCFNLLTFLAFSVAHGASLRSLRGSLVLSPGSAQYPLDFPVFVAAAHLYLPHHTVHSSCHGD